MNEKKLKLLREVLRLTENFVFTGKDSDADDYISLIEKRDILFAEIKKIDKKLAGQKKPESDKYEHEIKVVVRSIIAQDDYMREKVKKILAGIKADVKTINSGKVLSGGYNNISGHTGSMYDWSQ